MHGLVRRGHRLLSPGLHEVSVTGVNSGGESVPSDVVMVNVT